MSSTTTTPLSLSPVSSSSTTSTTSSQSQSKSKSKSQSSFWPRELVFGSHPHPSQLAGGRQRDAAPMCPCHDCWEYGSHAVAAAVRRAAKEAKRQEKTEAAASAAAAQQREKPASMPNNHPLRFLRRRTSRASVASDARPLRQSLQLASPAASVYEPERDGGYDV